MAPRERAALRDNNAVSVQQVGTPTAASMILDRGARLTFWAPDMAYSTGGSASYPGRPVEFIRDQGAVVTWMRVNGRIARKEGT